MVAIEDREPEMPVWGNFTWFGHRSIAEHATHLLPHIKPDSRIIDVGCGIGSMTLDLARRAPNGFVLGIDYSQESIDTATAAAQKLGLTNIEFRQCDVTTNLSEIPTSSFDIAHSHQVMIHLPNPPQVMTEIRRILKPQGGILAIRDNHSFYTHPNDPAVARNWEIYKIFSRRRGAHPDAGFVNHVWMHEAGFEWKDIEYGSAAWEPAGLDKGVWAEDQKKSFLPVYGVSVEEEDGEFMRDLAEGWDKWRDDPHSRFVGVDGWVIGVKNEE